MYVFLFGIVARSQSLQVMPLILVDIYNSLALISESSKSTLSYWLEIK